MLPVPRTPVEMQDLLQQAAADGFLNDGHWNTPPPSLIPNFLEKFY
jgi:hypothetical protein